MDLGNVYIKIRIIYCRFCANIANIYNIGNFFLIFIAKVMPPITPISNNSIIYNADVNHMAIYRPCQLDIKQLSPWSNPAQGRYWG